MNFVTFGELIISFELLGVKIHKNIVFHFLIQFLNVFFWLQLQI